MKYSEQVECLVPSIPSSSSTTRVFPCREDCLRQALRLAPLSGTVAAILNVVGFIVEDFVP